MPGKTNKAESSANTSEKTSEPSNPSSDLPNIDESVPSEDNTNSKSDSETAKSWKDKGNLAFKEKRFTEAISFYSSGLEENPQDLVLLSNRSACYLNIEMFEDALKDAELVLQVEPTHSKAIYRKIKSLLNLKRYEEADQFLTEDKIKILDGSTVTYEYGSQQLGKKFHGLLEQLKEQVQGKYNFLQFMNPEILSHDIASYSIPTEIQIVKGKGRGLFSKVKLSEGDLIMVQKAFTFIIRRQGRPKIPVEAPEGTENSAPANESNPQGFRFCDKPFDVDKTLARQNLIDTILDIVQRQPSLIKELYKLYAGPDYGYWDSFDEVDTERIGNIVDYNMFMADGRINYTLKELMAGIWILPSYINHSCMDGNCSWLMAGDTLIIRAIRDISPGDELLMSYYRIEENLEQELREQMLSRFQFKCKCSFCEIENSETEEIKTKRAELLKEFDNLHSAPGEVLSTTTDKHEEIVKTLENLRPNLKLNPYILDPYKFIARKCFRRGDYEKSNEILMKLYELVKGTEFRKFQAIYSSNIISAYLKSGQRLKAIEWAKVLKRDVEVLYGEPAKEILEIIAPDTMAKLQKNKINI